MFPGRHVDRTFTLCYLPTCLAFIAAFIRFPAALTVRARILGGFAGFFICMLAVPAVSRCAVTLLRLMLQLLSHAPHVCACYAALRASSSACSQCRR